jgi:predicted enzyme related to lactoylglutathione lyase
MKIFLTSVFVEDQSRALQFYTEKLGFVKKGDVSAGEYRWLTVVSPDNQDGAELLLEPNSNPAAKTYQKAIFEQKIPAAMFSVEDVKKEYERLKSLGVIFTMEPTQAGPAMIAVFDDTCGNLIQISEKQK